MSAHDSLPLINVQNYFDDPSIPDGNNIGFVDERGIVYRNGRPVGRDDQHPAHALKSDALRRLDQALKAMDAKLLLPEEQSHQAEADKRAAAPALPRKREIVELFEANGTKVAKCNYGNLWLLNGNCWVRMPLASHLPPLPQE